MEETNDIQHLLQLIGNSSDTYLDIRKPVPLVAPVVAQPTLVQPMVAEPPAAQTMVDHHALRSEAVPTPLPVPPPALAQNASKSELTLILESLVGVDRRQRGGSASRDRNSTDFH